MYTKSLFIGLPSSLLWSQMKLKKTQPRRQEGILVKFHLVPCQKKKKKWQGGDFLVEFPMQLCRTKGENNTYNYLGFRSSAQIALILRTLFSCHILFSLQQVYKLFGLQLGTTVQTLGAEFKPITARALPQVVIWCVLQERGLASHWNLSSAWQPKNIPTFLTGVTP